MSDNPKPYIGIKLSKDVESPEGLEAQMEAARARLAELARNRSIMERWDDFMMDWGPIAWLVLLLGIIPAIVSIPMVALMLWGLGGFCVTAGVIIAALVFAITR